MKQDILYDTPNYPFHIQFLALFFVPFVCAFPAFFCYQIHSSNIERSWTVVFYLLSSNFHRLLLDSLDLEKDFLSRLPRRLSPVPFGEDSTRQGRIFLSLHCRKDVPVQRSDLPSSLEIASTSPRSLCQPGNPSLVAERGSIPSLVSDFIIVSFDWYVD